MVTQFVEDRLSPPARGRGSKLPLGGRQRRCLGRPLRGGVDRNAQRLPDDRYVCGRPLRGGVDRNVRSIALTTSCNRVAPCAGAWIETEVSAKDPVSLKSPP